MAGSKRKEVHYAAFISYKHSPRDNPLAAALHKQLESFIFPSASIWRKRGRLTFGRAFHDKSDLPQEGNLSDALRRDLRNSDWLICLLCSEYFESPYCKDELIYFVSQHGIALVLPVITEGNASDLIPKFWDVLAKAGFDIPKTESGAPAEPLLTDFSDTTDKKRLKKVRHEKLRLFAAMLDVNYDDLVRRFFWRKVRIGAYISILAILLAIGTIYFAVQIEKQRTAAVRNEMHLLIQRSLSDSDNGNNLEATQEALEAYNRYLGLYPNGNADTQTQISQALSAAAYSHPYQLVQNIHNKNRLLWDFQYSPDDKYILGISGGGTALIDAVSGVIVSESAHGSEVNAARFSPSGKYYLAAEFWTSRVEIYETAFPEKPVAVYSVDTDLARVIVGAAFISDDTVLLSYSEGKLIKWDFASDKTETTAEGEALQGTAFTFGAAVSPDGKLAVCPLDFIGDTLPVIDLQSGKRLVYPMPVELGGRVFAFSNDSKLLAGAFVDTLAVWDTVAQKVIFTAKTDYDIIGLIFSPDGKTIAALTSENALLFNANDGKMLHTLGKFDEWMGYVRFGAAFSPDGKEVLIYGNSAEVYEVNSGNLISDIGGQKAISGAFSHNSKYMALITIEGEAGLYSTSAGATALPDESAKELYQYPQWFEKTTQTALLRQTHSYDKQLYSFAHEYMVNSQHGDYIASIYPDGYVEIWSAASKDGRSSFLLREHYGMIMQARMTEEYLLTAGYDGRVMVFDLKAGIVKHFINVGERIPRFEVSKAGDMLIALTESGTSAKVYDLRSGKRIYTLESASGGKIKDIGFTPDGEYAVIIKESGGTFAGKLYVAFNALLEHSNELVRKYTV